MLCWTCVLPMGTFSERYGTVSSVPCPCRTRLFFCLWVTSYSVVVALNVTLGAVLGGGARGSSMSCLRERGVGSIRRYGIKVVRDGGEGVWGALVSVLSGAIMATMLRRTGSSEWGGPPQTVVLICITFKSYHTWIMLTCVHSTCVHNA